ncbi:MAG: threonine--tRNA ligase [Clostridia bacterium]|nr:threonine--tRNA ligase [Clostridia bacterium]MDD4375780.1 threonine--tRNA ligase [Clostridia bacterium]
MSVKIIDKNGKTSESEYKDNISVIRHSASHVLAEAVKRVYKDAKLAIGPAVENGFYYDFDNVSIKQEDLRKIENIMRNIISQDKEIRSYTLSKEEALAKMKDEPYKIELINELAEDEEISFFENDDFVDLCAGPHLTSTKQIGSIKLLSVTGAYWRGSEENKMLTRIYGTAFETEKEVEEYLEQLEEAKRRDHNKLGRELELFTTVDYIGQGLPILMPKGARIIQILQRFVEDEEQKRGYLLTKTPLMAKSDLYKISGHWSHYRDGMFIIGDEDKADEEEVLALRPMTCPFQFMAYKNKLRSYKDLPFRYNETSTLFRNEDSGEMHGLIRLRQFTISEGHLVVRPDQLEEEVKSSVDLANYMLDVLGLKEDVSYRFSKWDPNNKEKYIGSEADWEKSQETLKKILDNLELEYVEEEGEAAFYGPKLDIQCKNVWGKEDTIITIQVDFSLAEKFNMTYVDSDGSKKTPIIIHRTSIGCYERTLALLIEKYAGAFPLWLAPVQAKILSISESHSEYAKKIADELNRYGFRVELDVRNEKIGYKIREARLEKVPYMLIVGDNEMNDEKVTVKARTGEDLGVMSLDDIKFIFDEEIEKAMKK